ncbi:MAG: hypothetical protein ACI9EW_003186 [Cellvibrionaceae bacterium]|jgi:hypothetical protein
MADCKGYVTPKGVARPVNNNIGLRGEPFLFTKMT